VEFVMQQIEEEQMAIQQPITLYEFLVFLDVSYNFNVPLKWKRVHCVILIH
jgi:hypothetical protein